MNIKVSIVIPFYQNFAWLTEAIESVLKQTYKNYEVIVINDGSLENDNQFIAKFKTQIQYFKTENKGPGHARNYGIALAKGEYIAFLDSDDLWLPNKLEKQLPEMTKNDWVWSHCSYYLFNDKTGEVFKEIKVGNFKGDIFLKRYISSPIGTPCVIIKKSFLDENPTIRFSEKLRYGQDAYLWGRISELHPLGAINDTLVKVRIRGSNAGRRARVQLQSRANEWIELHRRKKNKEEKFMCFPKIPIMFFKISFILNKFLCFLENKFTVEKKSAELIAKIFYAPIYFGFKFYNIMLKQLDNRV